MHYKAQEIGFDALVEHFQVVAPVLILYRLGSELGSLQAAIYLTNKAHTLDLKQE